MSAAPPEASGPNPGGPSPFRSLLSRLGPLLGLVAVWSLFAVTVKEGNFITWENQRLMLLQTAIVGTAAVGATLVIVSGGIDLSVGSAIALGTVVVALLLQAGVPPFLAGLGGTVFGALVGAAIGAMVTGQIAAVSAFLVAGSLVSWVGGALELSLWVSIPAAAAVGAAAFWWTARSGVARIPLSPFIVTLALWGGLRGIAKGLGDNKPVYLEAGSDPWLVDLMVNQESGPFAVAAPGVWIMLAVATFTALLLRHTRFGRHVYAIGSNEETARLCGIQVERRKIGIYAFASACAGLAAVLQFSYLGFGDPTSASGLELQVIAAVVIGGASLAGGEGSVLGTLVGALIMTVVDNGCTNLELANWVQEIVTGAIILGAVVVDRLRHR